VTTETSAGAGELAEQAADSAALEAAARAGLVAYGLVHLLIGWSALRIAWGERTASADSSGALRTLSSQPMGEVLLGLVAVGMVALALWQAGEAIWGYHNRQGIKRTRKRISSAGKSVVFLALGVSAGSFALGGSSSSSRAQERRTSGVLSWPAGQTIVEVAALVIIGIGVAHVVKGVKGRFRDELGGTCLSPQARRRACVLGQVGYIAKGLALGVVGGLLGYAALTFDPHKSRGLDGALRAILDEPAGRPLLTAMAIGFMAFGVFAVLQSRYRRM
jgi:hypothetical protein